MDSIGNDIVDLNFINAARTCSLRFYSKILSLKEQEQYQSHFTGSIFFEHYVWLLWSVKESVYKFVKRHHPELVFSPVKIEVSPQVILDPPNKKDEALYTKPIINFKSSVLFSDFDLSNLSCNSFITDSHISTVASGYNEDSKVISAVKKIETSAYCCQSTSVRKFLADKLTSIAPYRHITFSKSETGYPVILDNDKPTGLITSFAHHGLFVTYAVKIPKAVRPS